MDGLHVVYACGTEIIARHRRSYEGEDTVFERRIKAAKFRQQSALCCTSVKGVNYRVTPDKNPFLRN